MRLGERISRRIDRLFTWPPYQLRVYVTVVARVADTGEQAAPPVQVVLDPFAIQAPAVLQTQVPPSPEDTGYIIDVFTTAREVK